MSKDMTYEPVVTLDALRQRIGELEQLLTEATASAERAHVHYLSQKGRAELYRAKWNAVPVAEIRAVVGASATPMGYTAERNAIAAWLNSQAAQP
jgi:hypothetical protein